MAPRRPPPAPQHADLTPLRMQQGIKRLEQALAVVEAFDPEIKIQDDTVKAERVSAAVETALSQTFGHGTVEFNLYKDAALFNWPLNYMHLVPLHDIQDSLRRCRKRSLGLLEQALSFLKSELELQGEQVAPVQRQASPEGRPTGTNVVIGHGGSAVWLVLKEFIKERLKLPVDEFNAVSAAGLPTVTRLSEMLDDALFAFLVMTAEDAQPDGKVRARENVVHEAGLFQGRLGFKRAIVLLEDGCEEFSNIQGLGQIRFPKGNIAAKFEEVRAVLEREGLLKGPQ
jgi:predicted nucleotide-binding protein